MIVNLPNIQANSGEFRYMQRFTFDEAIEASTVYFGGDAMAADNFVGKYALKDNSGNILEKTPEMMHRRMAKELARAEAKYLNPLTEDEIFGWLSRWDLIPQGSPMSGIGNPDQLQSLSNCFVIDSPRDSYGGILFADQEQAQIMKRRGGVGFDISTIRPKDMKTRNAARTTDGIGVFMERFSRTCREVAQGGRRGALMISISCHHPEIETFIDIKRDATRTSVTGANISIRWSDEFMNAVKNGAKVQLRFPVEKSDKKPQFEEWVDAKSVWDRAMLAAWESAEPGALFWDTAISQTPSDVYASDGFESVSTNPCAEIILSRYDSCRLLVVNLWNFVIDPFSSKARFDFDRFAEAVRVAQRLMDDLVDLEIEMIDLIIAKVSDDPEPLSVKMIEMQLWQKIRTAAVNGRRTGLGITGLGDAIAGVGIRYGDAASIEMTDAVYRTLAVNSYMSSCIMAKERGAFPVFDRAKEENHSFLSRIFQASPEVYELWKAYGRRNIANTTTAPTGTTSILAQTTGGIEPAIFLTYTRKKKKNSSDTHLSVDYVDAMGDQWHKYTVYHHKLKKWMEVTGKTDVKESPYWGATSEDIDWLASVKLQAAAQRWICHAVSKTANLPKDTSVDLVKEIYMSAWESGCKGFTVYRAGSRDAVLTKDDEQSAGNSDVIIENNAPKRPRVLPCDIHRTNVKGEGYTVLVGLLDGKPYEVFCGLSQHVEVPRKYKTGSLIKNGKKDGVATYNLCIPVDDEELLVKDVVTVFDNPIHGATTRIISLALRHGSPLQYVVDQLQKDKHSDMQSFSRVISRVLKGYISDGTRAGEKTCSSCGVEGGLVYQEHCVLCKNCGSSKCS